MPIKGRLLTDELVQSIYGVALTTVSRVIEIFSGSGDLAEGVRLKQSFLLDWLTTPFDEMLFVRTVDDAGRWQIAINTPSLSVSATDEVLTLGCKNLLAWYQDRSAIAAETWAGNFLPTERSVDKYGRRTLKVWANPSLGDGCTFYGASGSEINEVSQINWMELNNSGEGVGLEVFPYFFADPRVKIATFN